MKRWSFEGPVRFFGRVSEGAALSSGAWRLCKSGFEYQGLRAIRLSTPAPPAANSPLLNPTTEVVFRVQ